jgi:hypothetical protein
MTLAAPTALFFALSALAVIFLALLRPRLERRDVSALFLWEGLRQDARSRRIHFRQLLDPILLLQVLAILLLAAALTLPLISSTQKRLSSLAIVIDGSGSMQTTVSGTARYELAVDEAKRVLRETPAAATSVIQFSSVPGILADRATSRGAVSRILDDSKPTWNGPGTVDGMLNALSAVGGLATFDRVVFITDAPAGGLPESIETIPVAGGENLGITAFSVRENPSGSGTTAFVEVRNETSASRSVGVRLSDGFTQTSLALVLAAGEAQQASIPFSGSRGTVFTATLDAADDFAADNERYCALDRPLDLRIRWIGPPNAYLSAALGAVTSFTLVSAAEDADLTVVNGSTIPASYRGTILLVDAEIQDVIMLGEERERASLRAAASTDPLLEGLRPSDIRVFASPAVDLPEDAVVLLEADGEPVLATWLSEDQDVTLLAPRLEMTNLPLSIDFPLLVSNIVSRVTRLPAPLDYAWTHVGDAVELGGRGGIIRLEGPDGHAIQVSPQDLYFFPETPGLYVLTTDRGEFALAVNVAPSESVPSGSVLYDEDLSTPLPEAQAREYWLETWPILIGLLILLLLAELLARHRGTIRLLRRSA